MTWMAAGRFDADVMRIRLAVWSEKMADALKANPHRSKEPELPVSRDESNKRHARVLELLKAAGPR